MREKRRDVHRREASWIARADSRLPFQASMTRLPISPNQPALGMASIGLSVQDDHEQQVVQPRSRWTATSGGASAARHSTGTSRSSHPIRICRTAARQKISYFSTCRLGSADQKLNKRGLVDALRLQSYVDRAVSTSCYFTLWRLLMQAHQQRTQRELPFREQQDLTLAKRYADLTYLKRSAVRATPRHNGP